jgi:2-hydroxychromene-2-carboxylate isomerase
MSAAPPTFYFGAMSPYSWLAAERIELLIPEARWRGVLAGVVFAAHGRTSWGLTDGRAEGLADCQARAESYGLGPIVWPPRWPTSDLQVSRAMLVAQRSGRLRPFALAAMRLSFLEGADLQDPEVVLEAASRTDIDPAEIGAGIAEDAIKQELRGVVEEALAAGVFGVPSIVVGGELFWGDDRLEDAAAAARRIGSG